MNDAPIEAKGIRRKSAEQSYKKDGRDHTGAREGAQGNVRNNSQQKSYERRLMEKTYVSFLSVMVAKPDGSAKSPVPRIALMRLKIPALTRLEEFFLEDE